MSTTLDSVPDYLPTNGRPIDNFGQIIDNAGQKLIIPAIIADIRGGTSAAKACQAHGLPLHRLFDHIEKDEQLRSDYAAAQRARAEVLADEVVTIADEVNADPQHNRNRMQARQWLASKTYAAKYGDKLQVEIDQRVSLADALKEASGRLLSTSYQVIADQPETLISTDSQASGPSDSQSDSSANELDDLLS